MHCTLCGSEVVEFDEAFENLIMDIAPVDDSGTQSMICPTCHAWYVLCLQCDSPCKFLGFSGFYTSIDQGYLLRRRSRDKTFMLVGDPHSVCHDEFVIIDERGYINVDEPIYETDDLNLYYYSPKTPELFLGSLVTGWDGGFPTFWKCDTCNRKFTITDK